MLSAANRVGQLASANDQSTLGRLLIWRAAGDGIAARPAVQRGLQVLADLRKPVMDDKAKEMLFGATQYQKR